MTATIARRFPLCGPMYALACWLRQVFAPGSAGSDVWPPRRPAEMAMWAQDMQPRRHAPSKGRALVEPGVRASAESCSRRPAPR